MKRLLTFLSLLIFPLFGLAQAIPTQGSNFNLLTPDAIRNGSDLSIGYLQDIFGVVDGVLHGSGSQIMGQMFMMFNAGALFLGAIIIIYTMLVSTLNTAHEGEIMGRKWKSIWIPVRSAAGIALLLPQATGYCTIQIFMMWVIVQGVGLADSVWNQATNYLARGGVVVQQAIAPQADVGTASENIFRSMVCVYGLQDAMQASRNKYLQENPKATAPQVPDLTDTVNPIKPTYDAGYANATVSFPGVIPKGIDGTDYSYLTGVCGNVTWKAVDAAALRNAGFTDPINSLGGVFTAIFNGQDITTVEASLPQNAQAMVQYVWAKQVGVQQIILDMTGPARQYVNSQFQFNLTGANKPAIPDPSTYLSSRMFLDAAEDYQGITYPSARSLGTNIMNLGSAAWIKTSQSQGWIMAGRYYADMAGMGSDANVFGSTSYSAPTANASPSQLAGSLKATPGVPSLPSALSSQVSGVIDGVSSASSTLNKFLSAPTTLTTDPSYGGRMQFTPPSASGTVQGVGDTIAAIILPIIGPIIAIIVEFGQLATAQGTNSNPVVLLSLIGANMMTMVVQIWIIGALSMGAITAGLGAIIFTTVSSSILAILQWITPFLWVIMGAFFVNGAVLVYYVPMIPFIYFLFGAIGWMILVIEAMVAAPIVALGITHPEGNEVLGKADPAVLILVNVFLRPSMMVIGLIAGIILSYVGVWVLNAGFFGAFWGQMMGTLSGIAWIFSLPAFLLIYTALVIAIMNQAFSLVNVIPDKILRWLGQAGESISGEAKSAAGEAQQGLKGGMQEASSGASQAAKASGERGDKRASGEATGSSGTGGSSASKLESTGPASSPDPSKK